MEDKNYHYPEWNEITLEGYELELNTWNGWVKGKFPHVLSENKELDEYAPDDLMKLAHAIFRVPLLTKEQIIEEGWVHIGGFWWEWPVKDTICVDEFSNRTLDFRLNFSGADKYIVIDAYERNSFEYERVYAGPCKTINELRTLMRWFNIK